MRRMNASNRAARWNTRTAINSPNCMQLLCRYGNKLEKRIAYLLARYYIECESLCILEQTVSTFELLGKKELTTSRAWILLRSRDRFSRHIAVVIYLHLGHASIVSRRWFASFVEYVMYLFV